MSNSHPASVTDAAASCIHYSHSNSIHSDCCSNCCPAPPVHCDTAADLSPYCWAFASRSDCIDQSSTSAEAARAVRCCCAATETFRNFRLPQQRFRLVHCNKDFLVELLSLCSSCSAADDRDGSYTDAADRTDSHSVPSVRCSASSSSRLRRFVSSTWSS